MLDDAERRRSIKSHRLQNESNSSVSNSMAPNWNWLVTAGVFIIQLLIPSVFSSYGVFLSRLIEDNYFLVWHGLLPPIIYISSKSFSDPICRNVLSGQSLNGNIRAMCAVLILAGSISVNVFIQSIFLQVFTLGIFGGISSSVVITQAETVLSCHFPSQRGLTQVLSHLGVALGYFGMPLVVNGLINQYGIHGSFLLQSGIVLQALIGAALLGPPKSDDSDILFANRPRAYTVVDDIEMVDFSSQRNGHSGHSPLLSDGRSWRNPATDSYGRYDVAQTSSPVIILRQKNIHGVDILPEIPEESEESSSESETSNNNVYHKYKEVEDISSSGKNQSFRVQEKSVEINVKKSKTNEQFQSNKSLHKWRNVNLHSEHGYKEQNNERIQNINYENYSEEMRDSPSFVRYCDNMRFRRLESLSDQVDERSLFQKLKYVFLCGCFNKASLYDFYITILNFPNDIHFYLVVPLMNAVKVPDFFPAVFLCTVLRLCPIVFTTFIPFLTKKRILESSSQEGAFTISVSAFSWLCFLLFSPCFLQAKNSSKKFIYFIGSVFLSTGFYIVSTTKSHGFIVLGSAFIGLGHGATSGTVMSIFEADMGPRNFVKIQGPLDVVSGFTILLTSVLLGFLMQYENGLFNCFITLTALQMATSIVWLVQLLKTIFLQLRNFNNSNWHPGGDFLTPG